MNVAVEHHSIPRVLLTDKHNSHGRLRALAIEHVKKNKHFFGRNASCCFFPWEDSFLELQYIVDFSKANLPRLNVSIQN